MDVVYVLKEIEGKRTYVGYTNNLEKRLRSHNGEISGGAKYTRGRKWEVYGYIKGFEDRKSALSFEWHLKNPYGKKRGGKTGIEGRIDAIKEMRKRDKRGLDFCFKNKIDFMDS